MNDSFDQYYNKKNKQRNPGDPPAFQLRGLKNPEGLLTVIEGLCSSREVLSAAKKRGVTATVLLTLRAAACHTLDRVLIGIKKPVVLTIPVNLRNYFDSQSARNFFSLIPAVMEFRDGVPPLEEIFPLVKEQFTLPSDERVSAKTALTGWRDLSIIPFRGLYAPDQGSGYEGSVPHFGALRHGGFVKRGNHPDSGAAHALY